MGDRSRLKEIFLAAREMPGEEREAYLAAQCGEDGGLRSQLEDLLRVEEKAPDFLQKPVRAPETVVGALRQDSSSSEQVGKLVRQSNAAERFAHVGELAEGGMGKILEVVDTDLRRTLAMKVIRGQEGAQSTGDTPGVDGTTMARFIEEAQITGQLEHSGVVPVHELGVDEKGRVYFTMRRVEGEDLGQILRRVSKGDAEWSRTRVVGVLQRVCETMAFAHEKGIVHRDLKPTNVMVGDFGEVYVMDWGLAHALDREDRRDIRPQGRGEVEDADPSESRDSSPLLTRDGDVLGTPAYMPPEQARGELDRMGPWSDVYAMGAILYHLLVGHAPYCEEGSRQTPMALLRRVQNERVTVDGKAPDAPAELVAICEKAMAREPGDRYMDMSAMADDFAAYQEGRVVRAYRTGALIELAKWIQRNRLAAFASVAAVVALVVGFFVTLTQMRETEYERDNVLRLSAFQKLDDLRTEADELWPVSLELIPRYEEWLQKAEDVIAGLQLSADGADIGHKARLDELRERGRLEAGVWSFPDDELDWWHGQLTKLIGDIEAFTDSEAGLIEGISSAHGWGIRRRLVAAEQMRGHQPELDQVWERARTAIREHADYGGLDLPRHKDLVPLGPDPDSELWEFAHIPSGAVPKRDDSGRLEFGAENGIVLVLVPPGDPIRILDPASGSKELVVEPFFLSKFEMTQAQWVRQYGTNPSGAPYDKDRGPSPRPGPTNPVEMVSWTDGHELLQRLGLAIPTPAQWAHATRGWETWVLGPNGEHTPDMLAADYEGQANFLDGGGTPDGPPSLGVPFRDGFQAHAPAGEFEANGFGLHEVFGNVSEWTTMHGLAIAMGGNFFTGCVRNPRTSELRLRELRIERTRTHVASYIGLRPARALVPAVASSK